MNFIDIIIIDVIMYDIFIQYIQLESLGIQEGEFAVSRDLLVDLWLKF